MRTTPWIRAILFLLGVAGIHSGDIRAAASRDERYGVPQVKQGFALSRRGEEGAALRNFEDALRINPNNWSAYYGRAHILMRQGKWEAAMQDVNEVVRMQPRYFASYLLRSSAHEYRGNYGAALADLKTAASLATNEDYTTVLNQRAWFRATCPDAAFRDGKQALADAKSLCQRSKWKDAEYLDTLAAAYAETGDFAVAIRYQEKALALGNFASTYTASRARNRLTLYKQGQPFRESH